MRLDRPIPISTLACGLRRIEALLDFASGHHEKIIVKSNASLRQAGELIAVFQKQMISPVQAG
jgi:hypothetical protein